ncbi:MAG: formate--tetrahydrofolate ligase, partial [Firmicutes bacterium]|nr:formate--tetrahydrofolate ligase [Bacillota bacterium]
QSTLALREPSLGPVFGIKGGATGGGYAQVAPMEDINLHFNGDFHAITSANNLLSSLIDNYIFQNNEIGIDPNKIVFNRCLDLNDRALREVTVTSSSSKVSITRNEKFNITAASEIMAIMCLSKDLEDLKENLGNITIGYTYDDKPVYAKDIKANEAMTILLKDALKPNLVQTLEHNPAIVHCGPFANIAHGCNSIIATDIALKLSDYVVTEAGFGADLGAEKFLDVKCRRMGIHPDAVVIVATVRALKLHGGADKATLNEENLDALNKGLHNLKKHIENMLNVYKLNTVVAINKFTTDTDKEINTVVEFVNNLNVKAIPINVWAHGGNGAIELAKEVLELTKEKNTTFNYCYDENDSIKEKIEKISKKIYGAKNVIFSEKANKNLSLISNEDTDKFPVVIAKTQYSLSDNPKLLAIEGDFDITIRDVEVRTGAKMIVALAGDMLLMPGLGKEPAATKMHIDKNEIIDGLF